MRPEIIEYDEFNTEEADILVIAHGVVFRSAAMAVRKLADEGLKVAISVLSHCGPSRRNSCGGSSKSKTDYGCGISLWPAAENRQRQSLWHGCADSAHTCVLVWVLHRKRLYADLQNSIRGKGGLVMDIQPKMPKSWNPATKPHKFCPGCGHGLVLKALGQVIDELGIQDRVFLGVISAAPSYPGISSMWIQSRHTMGEQPR